MERVQKVIANLGYASRREAERLIQEGKVLINGNVANLGDKVTILDKNLGVTLNTMITQIEETYESGKVTITPTFGNKIPSLLDKIRRHI